VFGSNEFGQLGTDVESVNQLTPIRLTHPIKFIDIASHWFYSISTAHSENGSFIVCGKCGEEIRIPIETS